MQGEEKGRRARLAESLRDRWNRYGRTRSEGSAVPKPAERETIADDQLCSFPVAGRDEKELAQMRGTFSTRPASSRWKRSEREADETLISSISRRIHIGSGFCEFGWRTGGKADSANVQRKETAIHLISFLLLDRTLSGSTHSIKCTRGKNIRLFCVSVSALLVE